MRDKGNGVNHLGCQRCCKTVILDAFHRRLWLNTVVRSRFLIYYGIIEDTLVVKNSAFTKAIWSPVLSAKRTFVQNLPVGKLSGGLVCLWVCCPLGQAAAPPDAHPWGDWRCGGCPLAGAERCAATAPAGHAAGWGRRGAGRSPGGEPWSLPARTHFQSL